MSMNSRGRPTAPGTVEDNELPTISGDRGLQHEVSLIFELGRPGMTGVDIPQVQVSDTRLGGLRRKGPVGLPGLSEPEVIRHYVRLSQLNYSIDAGLYPLGSCTMKHNPRLNEKMARLPGFADVHPLAPQQTVQGAFEAVGELMKWLTTLTGMPVSVVSHFISSPTASNAPCTVCCGASGCTSAKPGSRAIFSLRRGLCFIVQEPSG